MMTAINIKLKPEVINATYRPYLMRYDNRYEVYYGGAGSGKSHFIAQKLQVKALNSKRKVLVTRKVAVTLRDSCFQLFIEALQKFGILQFCQINLSNLTITLPNGSMLLFRGLEDVERLKSIAGICDCWQEEATEANEEDFLQLDLRLRARVDNLQFFLSFNPVSKANWCYKHWFENGTPDNTFILKTTYKDNAFLPAEYVARLEDMKQTNPTWYNIYALGDFCTLDKLIYNNYTIVDFDLKAVPGQVIVGLDFGYVNSKTALVLGKIDVENKKIYIAKELYRTGMLNDEIAKQIIYMGLSKEIIIADSAEQKSIEEIRRLGVLHIKPASKGQGSVLQGIQFLQQFTQVVHPSCDNFLTEIQNYSWKKDAKSNEYVNVPIDDYNHLLDALRYGVQVLENRQKLQSISKAMLGL